MIYWTRNCADAFTASRVQFLCSGSGGPAIPDWAEARVDAATLGDLSRLLRRLLASGGDWAVALEGFVPLHLISHQRPEAKAPLTWDHVGGLEDAKRLLTTTFIWPIKYPSLYASVGVELGSAALLYGPSGCGKTLLAAALAHESGFNSIVVKGPELLSKYIGASEQAVRDTFARARAATPCLLFFDEFDALAPRRGHDSTGVTDRVVNQLLTELDGVEGLGAGVGVLVASSRPDLLDPALLRPGRLQRHIRCPLPDRDARERILSVLLRGVSVRGRGDWRRRVATETEGFSGADLSGLVTDARLAGNSRFDEKGEEMEEADLYRALEECRMATKPSSTSANLSRAFISDSDLRQKVTLA